MSAAAGYSTKEVAKLLGLSPRTVAAFVKDGFVAPLVDLQTSTDAAPPEARFSFQDLVLLRTAKGLVDAEVAPARVRRALDRLRRQLPEGRSLTSLRIVAEGNRLIVQDEDARWNPESGQVLFDFGVRALSEDVAPLHKLHAERAVAKSTEDRSAHEWFTLGCELEIGAPTEAQAAYERAVALDAGYVDARINLGRLLHEAGKLDEAEAHYRAAIATRPGGALAWFNLGLVLWARTDLEGAINAFALVIQLDAQFADAHYNLSRIYEARGQKHAALRHLRQYKRLVDGR